MGLNKERIRLWVDALRSGKYKQTEGRLSDKVGYCCLGVACEVASKDIPIEKEYDKTFKVVYYNSEDSYLPHSVINWFGLDSENPCVIDDYSNYTPLSSLNDEGLSFSAIADFIEKEYLTDEQPNV